MRKAPAVIILTAVALAATHLGPASAVPASAHVAEANAVVGDINTALQVEDSDAESAFDAQVAPSPVADPTNVGVSDGRLVASSAAGSVGPDYAVAVAMPETHSPSIHVEDQAGITTTLSAAANADFTAAVRDETDGSFRGIVHIASADAPNTYTFDLDLPAGGYLLEDTYGITAHAANGELLGSFGTPWAVDANGRELRTTYTIQGTSVVQQVRLTSATAFPVVADPFWIPAFRVMARLSGHVAKRARQRGVPQSMIQHTVQYGRQSRGKEKGTTKFSTGNGKTQVNVIVNNKTGTIITVTKGP